MDSFKASLERGFELIDLTVETNLTNVVFVREMLRFREVLAGIYVDPVAKAQAAEFKSLIKVLLTLDPDAYNLLGITF